MANTIITKPVCGMTLAFMPAASKELADVPGRVVAIWPRFRGGDYLVTLEYAQPVKCRNELIQHIEAFVSELYCPPALLLVPVESRPAGRWRRL
jgi:hypothetical protein